MLQIDFNMKVYIIFAICVVAVFATDDTVSTEMYDKMFKESAKTCLKEMNLDPRLYNSGEQPDPKADIKYPSNEEETCFQACLDKKMGAMNEDGTYNIERMVSFAQTPENKRANRRFYNFKIKECTALVGTDPCRMAACLHNMPKSYYMKEE